MLTVVHQEKNTNHQHKLMKGYDSVVKKAKQKQSHFKKWCRSGEVSSRMYIYILQKSVEKKQQKRQRGL